MLGVGNLIELYGGILRSHWKLGSTVNLTPILPMMAAVDYSHHELHHGGIHIIFLHDDAISRFRGIMLVLISREIIKNKL